MLLLLIAAVLIASSEASTHSCLPYNEDTINGYKRAGFRVIGFNRDSKNDAEIKLYRELQDKIDDPKYFIKLEECFLQPPRHRYSQERCLFVYKSHFLPLVVIIDQFLELSEGARAEFYYRVLKVIQFFDGQGIITLPLNVVSIGFRTTDNTFTNPIIICLYGAFKKTEFQEVKENLDIVGRNLPPRKKNDKDRPFQIRELIDFLYALEKGARKEDVEKQEPGSYIENEDSLYNLLLFVLQRDEWREKGYKALGKALLKFVKGDLSQNKFTYLGQSNDSQAAGSYIPPTNR